MKAVLMAIHPKWCEKIFSGEKTIEVRKVAPRLKPPFKVYMYETQGATETPRVDEDGHFIWKGIGKVVGEFVCDKTIELPCETTQPHWLKEKTCLSDDEYIDYLGHKDGKGLYITDPKRYDTPKDIKKFRKPCPYGDLPCRECPSCEEDESGHIQCFNTVNRPPQSFCYVEEIKE